MDELFRFSWETDEQYLERAQQVQGQVQVIREPESAAPSQGGGFELIVPWWAVVIFGVIVLALLLQELRKRSRRRRTYHPTKFKV